MTRRWWITLLVLLAPCVQAATVHAFLDRSHVSLGDTVTLNIQSSGSLGSPDLSPLQKDFEVLGTSRSSSVQIVNGKSTSTSQLGIALKPLHAGTLTIPALDVGGAKTQPLTLQVGAASSGGTGKVGDPVFMQASVKSSSPWVDQQTVYTVRLFYLPGVDGSLSDPSANGARLIQLDRDHRYVTERDGYTYKVIERSWALIPQRSGPISVQGPVFQGQRMGPGIPNAWFNNPNALLNSPLHGFGGSVRATAPVTHIDARAMPANVDKPWLPARDVQLKLTGLPADGKMNASAPLTVTLSISASGQPADALPEPELPAIAGARVYPDQTQDATDDSGEWLQGSRTRSFAIVPDRNGTLTIPAITLNWWDVTHNRAERATLPVHTLAVSDVTVNSQTTAAPPPAAVSTTGAAPTASVAASGKRPVPAAGPNVPWKVIALASIVLWGLVMVVAFAWWGLQQRQHPGSTIGTEDHPNENSGDAQARASDDAAAPPAASAAATREPPARALQAQALDSARAGDAAACEHALLAWARAVRPEITHAGLLRDALSDRAQCEALDELQRARWQGGDTAFACAAVARAFANGFGWRGDDKPARAGEQALPPLYPS